MSDERQHEALWRQVINILSEQKLESNWAMTNHALAMPRLVDYPDDEGPRPLPTVKLPRILISPYIRPEEDYSVHASLNWNPDPETATVLQAAVPAGFQSLLYSDLKVIRALHVSLSQNVIIKGKFCAGLLSEMRDLARSLGLDSARLSGSLGYIASYDHAAEFLALRFEPRQGLEQLEAAIQRASRILTDIDPHASVLEPQSAHISIARRPFEGSPCECDQIERLRGALVEFSALHVRVGTSVYEFPLNS